MKTRNRTTIGADAAIARPGSIAGTLIQRGVDTSVASGFPEINDVAVSGTPGDITEAARAKRVAVGVKISTTRDSRDGTTGIAAGLADLSGITIADMVGFITASGTSHVAGASMKRIIADSAVPDSVVDAAPTRIGWVRGEGVGFAVLG